MPTETLIEPLTIEPLIEPRKIKRILLDLDDVCNCFTMSALRHVGCPVFPTDDSTYPDVGFDIVEACNLLHPTKKNWTRSEFWDSIPRDLWAELHYQKNASFCS